MLLYILFIPAKQLHFELDVIYSLLAEEETET